MPLHVLPRLPRMPGPPACCRGLWHSLRPHPGMHTGGCEEDQLHLHLRYRWAGQVGRPRARLDWMRARPPVPALPARDASLASSPPGHTRTLLVTNQALTPMPACTPAVAGTGFADCLPDDPADALTTECETVVSQTSEPGSCPPQVRCAVCVLVCACWCVQLFVHPRACQPARQPAGFCRPTSCPPHRNPVLCCVRCAVVVHWHAALGPVAQHRCRRGPPGFL